MTACTGAAQTPAFHPFAGIQTQPKGYFPSFQVSPLSCNKSERDPAQKVKSYNNSSKTGARHGEINGRLVEFNLDEQEWCHGARKSTLGVRKGRLLRLFDDLIVAQPLGSCWQEEADKRVDGPGGMSTGS